MVCYEPVIINHSDGIASDPLCTDTSDTYAVQLALSEINDPSKTLSLLLHLFKSMSDFLPLKNLKCLNFSKCRVHYHRSAQILELH